MTIKGIDGWNNSNQTKTTIKLKAALILEAMSLSEEDVEKEDGPEGPEIERGTLLNVDSMKRTPMRKKGWTKDLAGD